MPVDKLFGTTVDVLAKSIDLRARRHAMISANLANVETPNYAPTGLSFEDELRGALKGNRGAGQSLTNPRHIPLKGQAASLGEVHGRVIDTSAGTPGKDNNGVELEAEMARMAENQVMYNATVQMINKKFEGLKTAIKP